MIENMSIKIEGRTPLLLHNGMMADPLNPATQELKKVSGKKTKTIQDHMDMARLEWFAGLYLAPDGKTIIVPGINIEKSIIEAARKSRKGKQCESGVMVDGDIPLDFADKGKSLDKIYDSNQYADRRMVAVDRKRIARTRPKFQTWGLSFRIDFDNELVNRADLIDIVDLAGQLIGLGDYRPRFGKFERVS